MNYTRRQIIQTLVKAGRMTEEEAKAEKHDSEVPETLLYAAGFFRSTLQKIQRTIPLPKAKMDPILKLEVEEISFKDFAKFIITEQQDMDDDAPEMTLSDNLATITTHPTDNPDLEPWPEAFRKYIKLTQAEKEKWKDQVVFYPLPLAAFYEESSPQDRQEFRQRATEASKKWRTPDTNIARIYPTTQEWKEGLVMAMINDQDELLPSMQAHEAN